MAELQTLEELLADWEVEPRELAVPLEAALDGRRVTVTAVLERTAVYEPVPADGRQLAARSRLLVDPSAVRKRAVNEDRLARARRAGRKNAVASRTVRARERTRFNNYGPSAVADVEEARRRSDERALKDQGRHEQGR